MYNEQHTKRVLEDERKNETAVIGQNRSANLVTDRQIKQMRTFTSKKDEAHAKMKEEYEELNEELAKLNEDIAKKAVKLDQDTRAYKDRNFMKRYNDELMTARQEHSMIGIDVNVSDSRMPIWKTPSRRWTPSSTCRGKNWLSYITRRSTARFPGSPA